MRFLEKNFEILKREYHKIFEKFPFTSHPLVLTKLNQLDVVQRVALGSDKDCGGNSNAQLIFNEKLCCGQFHGEIVSNPDGPMYATFRIKKRNFFRPSWDLSCYRYLSLCAAGDSRTYSIDLQTTSFLGTDLYRTSLTFKSPRKWEIITIPFNNFCLNRKDVQLSSHRFSETYRIQAIGISLLDRHPGPFELYLRWMHATNKVYLESDFPEISTCKIEPENSVAK
ncbi:hypothetical protein T552_02850 [Pneumocystis carinii B80]|uniref:NADH:ubiquinone oxidoreductase intermediate-associated protein 30 domain-containing protein n=1 Tax=Pneumocystis carinii (strain B80) TaxID=1408658 RepID=A0A0W4ZD91_PNEC8|nr:hypothetical protein T552_02850 [Pneumocystis carinii B80]KTW26368.1 hypothetical protein T552_02850 [Pneumocystis carinii B80]